MMFDDAGGRKVAGGASAILSDPGVAEVYGLFGDMCLERYGFDIRERRSFMSAQVLRQVQSFVREYGVEDAKRIVERLFDDRYRGSYEGKTIGTSIFSKGYRWLANRLLMEKVDIDAVDVSGMSPDRWWVD